MICKECKETIQPFDCPLCDFKTIENSCLECHFEMVHDMVDYTPTSCSIPTVQDKSIWDSVMEKYEEDNK